MAGAPEVLVGGKQTVSLSVAASLVVGIIFVLPVSFGIGDLGVGLLRDSLGACVSIRILRVAIPNILPQLPFARILENKLTIIILATIVLGSPSYR